MIFLLPLLLSCPASQGESSIEVVDRACQAIDAIESFHCKTFLMYGSDVIPLDTPGVELLDGMVVSAVTERWVDFPRNLERMVRHELQRFESPIRYVNYECAEDGEFYTGLDRGQRVGQIAFPRGIRPGVTVHNLLGSAIGGRRLPHQLRDGVLDPKVSAAPSGLIIVSGTFDPVDGSYRRNVKLWCDPERGWFPTKMEVRFVWSGTLNYRITIDQLLEKDGVWFPLAGTFQGWAIEENYPDGLTNADINAMTPEEWKEVEPRVTYTESVEPSAARLSIDPKSVEVNELWAIDSFRLDIPAGFKLHDLTQLEASDSESDATGEPPADPVVDVGNQNSWSLQARWLLVGNVAFIVLAAVYYGWKRKRSQSVLALMMALSLLSGCGQSVATPARDKATELPATRLNVIGGASIDFGEQFEHSIIEHRFTVRNDSGDDIELKKGLSTNCGCTTAALEKTLLRPGEIVEIDMAVHVPANAGEEKTYTAVLHALSPHQVDIPLNVTAKTKAFWSIFPPAMEIRSSRVGPSQTQLEIQGVQGREFNITGIQIPIPDAKYELSHNEAIAADSPCVVTFTIPPGSGGRYQIGIRTTDKDCPNKTVLLTIRADALTRLLPKRVSLRVGEDRVLKIVHPRALDAAGFRCDSECITLEVLDTETFEDDKAVTRVRVAGMQISHGFVQIPVALSSDPTGRMSVSLLAQVLP